MVWWGVVTSLRALLGTVAIGAQAPIAVMGALNVSPESFYPGSVHRQADDLLRAAAAMVEAGAALLDVGARSTAPYRAGDLGEPEEADRLERAVEVLASKLPVPISADTTRVEPAVRALRAGAVVLNDIRGLEDGRMAEVAAGHGAALILMASPPDDTRSAGGDPLGTVHARLGAALARARAAGIPEERVVLDPGIGFFRHEAVSWDVWDTQVLAGLPALAALGRPLCVGVSRKSFLGAITGRHDPGERLAASLAATTVAVMHGAALIRTHDVAETLDAVRVAERLRQAAP
jgi:dihydropteroate synthase